MTNFLSSPYTSRLIIFLVLNVVAFIVWERKEITGLIPSSTTKAVNSNYNSVEANNDLTDCEELMSRPYSAFANGDFITRASTSHDWVVQPDGSRQFELRSICRLKRYTALEARQCLAGKHISMIGDSLTRYQYLSLVHFIHKGEWPPNFGMESPCRHFLDAKQNVSSCSTEPHINLENDFKAVDSRIQGWSLYHETIGGSDDGGIFDGHLECQCRRGPGVLDVGMTYDAPLIEPSLESTKITHFMESGWIQPDPISGWNFTGCSVTGTCRYTKEHGEELLKQQAYDYSQNITTLLDPIHGMLPRRFPKTDFAVYNRGIWGGLPKDRAQTIMPLLRNWTRPSNGRCFYKATTSGNREPPLTKFDQDAATVAYNEGCSFLDFGHVTSEFGMLHDKDPERRDVYWDSIHFLPWVYAELNNILLNVLCNGAGPFISNSTSETISI